MRPDRNRRLLRRSAPIVVLDARTGRRVPYWAELDSAATDKARQALIIHPAIRLADATRYVVALRDLRTADGSLIAPPPGFAAMLKPRPPRPPLLHARWLSLRPVFRILHRNGITSAGLYQAWDFTTASSTSLTGRALYMRDQAFARLGRHAPGVVVTSVRNYPARQNANITRIVTGYIKVPSYLNKPDGPPGSMLHYASARPGPYAVPQQPVPGAAGHPAPAAGLRRVQRGRHRRRGARGAGAGLHPRRARGPRHGVQPAAEPQHRLHLVRAAARLQLPGQASAADHPRAAADAVGPGRGRRVRRPHHLRSAARHAGQAGAAARGVRRPPGRQCRHRADGADPSGAHLTPALRPHRSLDPVPFWGIPAIRRFPFPGSALVVWDSGSPPAPPANVPPTKGHDPHGDPGNTPAAQEQAILFLLTGEVFDTCGAQPCLGVPASG